MGCPASAYAGPSGGGECGLLQGSAASEEARGRHEGGGELVPYARLLALCHLAKVAGRRSAAFPSRDLPLEACLLGEVHAAQADVQRLATCVGA